MFQDVELTAEFFKQLAEVEERPETVVEKLRLSVEDLQRFGNECEFSPEEDDAFKLLLDAALRRERQRDRHEGVSAFLADMIKSVGAVALVVIGGLSQFTRVISKRGRTRPKVAVSTQGSSPKASLRVFEAREQERGLSHEQ
jgi:hypothetical protein